MNKPNYVKYLSVINSDKYRIFVENGTFEQNKKYNREKYFDTCKTFFLVERFQIKDNELCKKFFDLSIDLTKTLSDSFGMGSIYNIQFSLLPPLSSIKSHYDTGLVFSLSHRVHLPIITNDQSFFKIGDQEFKFKVNQLVEINNKKIHSVVNKSETEKRVHLILDYLPQKYNMYL